MNKISNNILLNGEKYIPELHLKQPGYTYSVCGPFTKHRERIETIRETCNLKRLYRNEPDKAYFTYDRKYSYSKNTYKNGS